MSSGATTAPDRRVCLLVGYDGIDAEALDGLSARVPGLQVAGEAPTAALGALARCWQTIDGFGPLKGHREGAQVPGAAHPWYGADQTDPGQLAARLGAALLTPALWPEGGTGPACLVSRQVFWTWDEARDFCRFFLQAMPRGTLILTRGPVDAMAEIFATHAGWSREAAGEAVALMAQHMDGLAETWPDRCINWDVSDPGSAVAVAAALAQADMAADTGTNTGTGQAR